VTEIKAVKSKAIDWADYSDEDIERFLKELVAEQKKRQGEKRQALKTRIQDMVKQEGLSLADLFPQAGKTRGRPKAKPQGEAPRVKYRNPADASQTWTGTGRKPAWVRDALASGKTLADLVG
jgi:DNA-binding protein H-NS